MTKSKIMAIAVALAAIPSTTLVTHASEIERCNYEGSTIDISECLSNVLKSTDQVLNRNYQELRKQLDAEGRKLLKTAQLQWLAFRGSNCDFEADSMRGGTGAGMLLLSCMIEMTEARANELQKMKNDH